MTHRKRKSGSGGPGIAIPKAVVNRLSLYLRELQNLVREGSQTTSSRRLGSVLGFSDAQVRKDLAYFGQFGYPGIGYRCRELIEAIKHILGTDHQWPVAMVGVGNLGRALLGYRGFLRQGFRIDAAFDLDPQKIGRRIDGVDVYDLARLSEIVRAHNIRLGIIAVPADSAQATADTMVAAGITGILNFAPATVTVPPEMSLVAVDLAVQLEQLSFSVAHRLADMAARAEETK